MKKIIFAASLLALFGCEWSKFTGYIVCKEFIPEHMSNETVPKSSYSGVFIPRALVVVSHQTKIEEKYIWYVANKYRVIDVDVTKEHFYSKKCGDLVTVIDN